MFWDGAVAGLGALLYWETYVACLEYLAIFIVPGCKLSRQQLE